MRIQEEAPLPQSPLATFESDYAMAVIHLAWDLRRGGDGKEDERTLLFAFVELVPAEVPPPNDDYEPKDPRCHLRLGGQSEHKIYVRHAVVRAEDALAWYLGCRRGVAILPEDGRFRDPDAPGTKRLRLADLGEEPPWPALVCAADNTDALPFAAAWAECPRTHHLIPLADFNLGGLWSKSEQERAQAWLEDHLHFSLEDYPEYWGSVHLVAPNPVYRQVHAGRQPRVPRGESVVLCFEPRAGKSAVGLQLVYRGASASGERLYEHTAPVQSELVRMNFEHRAQAFQADTIDPTRGMLHNSTLLSVFIGSFNISTNIGGPQEIKGPTPESTYIVNRSRPVDRGRSTEAPKIASAEQRLAAASARRQKRAVAVGSNQRWFRGQQEEAQQVLRGLIHGAEREVLIVDPYFGHLELWVFTFAVGREDVPVRVLTSAKNALEEEVEWSGQKVENGDLLFAQIERLRSRPHMNPFGIKVMTGKSPAVHDRFLLVDDRLWLLGSSLNEFASRGTMMVSLLDPEPVREQLAKVWDDAVDLETWVKRRRRDRVAKGQAQA